MPDTIVTTSNSATLTITLNRPEKLNVFSLEMLDQLEQILLSARESSELRVLIIRGAGGRAFSAGADITAFAKQDAQSIRDSWIPRGHRVFRLIEDLPQVTVAAIEGVAFGGGLELALACDIRVARSDSQFALPELALGTTPGWGGTGRLVEVVGVARARHMILTATRIDAETALAWGLVTEVYPEEGVEEGLTILVDSVLATSASASRLAKRIIQPPSSSQRTEALETLAGSLTATTSDLAEGIAAFTEKRPPQFGQ